MAYGKVTLNINTTDGKDIGVDTINDIDYERVKMAFGSEGVIVGVDAANPLPVTDNAAEVSLGSIDLKTPSQGQALMAASSPVAIASNQSAIPISGTVTVDTSLLATSAKQDTGNTSLASIKTNTDNLATPTTIFNGKTTVTTAGTRTTLAASQAVKSVTIKAALANTGTIYVGNATVAAANGLELAAGETISLEIANLNTVNIDASTNSQSVTYIGIN